MRHLRDDERALLEAASVCGLEFQAEDVAQILDQDAASVGRLCDELARGRLWLRNMGSGAPHDARNAHYVFLRAIYRQVLYERLGPVERAELHRNDTRQEVTEVGLGATLRHVKKTFDASFQDGLVQQGGEEGAHR